MARDFDAEINVAEENLQSTLSEMGQVQELFIEATVEFLKPFWLEQIESIVKGEPEVTKTVGKERLGVLKKEVQGLEERTSSIVSSYLNEDKLWWHRSRVANFRRPNAHSYEPPSSIDNALRFAAGELAKIFEGYGYLSTKTYMRSSAWRAFNKQGGSYTGNYNDPFYPKAWGWSKEMLSAMRKYESLTAKALSQEAEVKKIKAAKTQNEAEDLWNQA